jgi:hypothetical protein
MTIDADNGILLKPETPFQKTMPDEVASCLRYHGKPKSLEDMEKAIIISSKMEQRISIPPNERERI